MVTMSEGRIFSICAILTACLPASLAKARRSGLVDGISAVPGSASPSASAMICIVDAVPILEENLQPGDRLPNETILSERLNAGRSSVREAMKLLASRNIVTIRQGSGTYIASSPGMVEDPLGFTFIGNKQKLIHDLLEVRFLLEPSIAAMAAANAEEKDIKKSPLSAMK